MTNTGNNVHVAVVGSVNLDLVARVPRLPRAGETVTDGELGRYPGGKGANQALAAQRLGARVSLLACVGADAAAGEALALLEAAGVDLSRCGTAAASPTGIALIAVDERGENQIVVAPGANRCLQPERIRLPPADALLCQLEVPLPSLLEAAHRFQGFFCINLAPALAVPEELLARADLVVVNEGEAAFYGEALHAAGGYIAVTRGAAGAELRQGGEPVARAVPPAVTAVDATGAGDAFTAALTVALTEGRPPQAALAFACAAGAAATGAAGAQPALPSREAVEALLDRAQASS